MCIYLYSCLYTQTRFLIFDILVRSHTVVYQGNDLSQGSPELEMRSFFSDPGSS